MVSFGACNHSGVLEKFIFLSPLSGGGRKWDGSVIRLACWPCLQRLEEGVVRGRIFRWFGLSFYSLDGMRFVIGSQCGSSDFLVQLIRKHSCHAYDIQSGMLSYRDLLRNITKTSLKQLIVPLASIHVHITSPAT